MPRTVAATQARIGFGGLMDEITEHDETVVVERGGRPTVVMLSYERYRRLETEERRARHLAALDRLAEIQRQVTERVGNQPVPLPEDVIAEAREERDVR